MKWLMLDLWTRRRVGGGGCVIRTIARKSLRYWFVVNRSWLSFHRLRLWIPWKSRYLSGSKSLLPTLLSNHVSKWLADKVGRKDK